MPVRCSNMDSYKDVFYAAGLPALISTGITLVYFLLKAYQFAVYAVSHQTEGRLAAAMPGGCKQERGSIEGDHEKMQKDCQAEGIEVPKTMMAKDPVAHMVTPQEYLQKVVAGQMP